MVMNPKRRASLMLRNIPRDLRDQFKAWAAKRGKNMTELLVGFMRKTIKEDK